MAALQRLLAESRLPIEQSCSSGALIVRSGAKCALFDR
uniref:Uncharacterized protein n=1 Tax=Rhizobium leguminosarum bv. viciae TaxID=387 RepID=A0A0U3J6Y2_RHILV|nr:hypothetical protein [Rhizobium leguminosarum bv. viciae]